MHARYALTCLIIGTVHEHLLRLKGEGKEQFLNISLSAYTHVLYRSHKDLMLHNPHSLNLV